MRSTALDIKSEVIFRFLKLHSTDIRSKDVNMEETCNERQENELQAIQAIYMDDFQDLREKVGN